MRIFHFLVLAVFAAWLSACTAPVMPEEFAQENVRAKYNFNSGWLLYVGDAEGADAVAFDDASWKPVTLPHAYNEDDAFHLPIHEHTTGISWYRKHFRVPADSRGRKIFLEFEGVRFGGDFYLNGKHIGFHENGVMAAGLDVTDDIVYDGENVLAVRLDNNWDYAERATGTTYQWNNINFNANYGGIPKNVYLHVTDKVYQTLPLYSNLGTTGTYVYASDIDVARHRAVIHAEAEVRNESDAAHSVAMRMVVEDMDGQIVKSVKGEAQTVPAGSTVTIAAAGKASNLNFWSWGYGYLYNVYTALEVDGVCSDVLKTRTGFRKTQFGQGMFWLNDQVLQLKGYAQRTSNEWPAVGMSVPAWLSDFSNRMIVEGNGNLVRWMHVTPWKQDVESCDRVGLIQAMPAGDAESDITGRKWEQRKELMRDAIIYNRNNPSIIFYECGNESISFDHMAEMKAIRDQYDPHGGRAIGSREMLDVDNAEYGGEMLYINKSAKHPMWATEYCRDEGLRKYWDNYSYPFHPDGYGPLYRNALAREYNRNQDSYATQMVERWNDYYMVRPGTGKRVSSGGVNIVFSDSNTHYRGAENYRRSGEVDAMRIPKDAYFAHKLMWDCWIDADEVYDTYIIGHWNYADTIVKDEYVVSNGEKVELFVNGKSKGFGERNHTFLFKFPAVPFESGTIEAVSYAADGRELSRTSKKTAGAPTAIALKAYVAPDGFKADGADLALLEFEVVDADGNRCPLANDLVTFSIDGDCEWRGGLAQGPDNYILATTLPVECGINRALVRSTPRTGTVRITASAEGLKPATVTLQAVPFEQQDGLSRYISGEHQPSYLDRGPTPKENTLKIKRISVDIASIKAENAEQATRCYDDNELSSWSVPNAEATFVLARKAKLAEMDLKGSAGRGIYALLIDGKEVWRGRFTRASGYVNNIQFEPTEGQEVTLKWVENDNTRQQAASPVFELAGSNVADFPGAAAPTDNSNPNNTRGFGNLGVTNETAAQAAQGGQNRPQGAPQGQAQGGQNRPQGQSQNGPRGGQGTQAGAPQGAGNRGGNQRPASLSLTEIEFYELP